MNTSPLLSYIVNHLWQSTLFAALAWLLTVTLLRNNRAQIRYAVWLAASLKFLVPFAALVSLGSRFGWLRLAPPATQVKLYFAMDEASRQPAPRVLATALLPATPAPAIHLSDVLLLLWACGIAIVAIRWFLAWRRVHAALAGATPLQTFDGIPVLSSPALRDRGLEPGVVGLFKAVILVPEGIADRLTPEQFAAVLTHECCHARRRDNLAAALHMLVEAVFWFHPLVWWMGQRLMRERERACDEDVLRRHNDPEVYAEGILNVCKFYLESPMQCVSGITGADLKHRIADIMTRRRSHDLDTLRKAFLSLAGFAAIAGPIALGLLEAPVAHAQTAYEVASVKPNISNPPFVYLNGPPTVHTFAATNATVEALIVYAYQVRESQIEGGPGWLRSDRFDITAKPPAGAFTRDQYLAMLQVLLENRFRLVVRRETKEAPIYALVPAKGGLKIKPASEACAQTATDIPGAPPPAPGMPPVCGNIRMGANSLDGRSTSMTMLLRGLGNVLGRTVIDKTGYTGTFDIHLAFSSETTAPFAASPTTLPDNSGPTIFTALQEQLGLRLESQKGPSDVLVIDHAEKLSEAVAQTGSGSAVLAFDAATIRSNTSASPDVDFTAPVGGRFIARNVSLKMLLMRAYKAKNFEIAGGAPWLDSARWDIAATAPPTLDEPQFKLMLQSLMADRFQLQAHRETRQLSGYKLSPAKTGTKLPAPTNACFPHDAPPPAAVAGQPPPIPCGGLNMDGTHLEGRKVSMPLFAGAISNMLGRPVHDNTGYAGTFDVHLAFAPEGIAALSGGGFDSPSLTASASGSANPTLFTSIERQMGLRLESQKVPAEILVIDRAERPSRN